MMGKMVDAMAAPMQKLAHEQYLKDKLSPDFEQQMTKIMNDMFKSFPWDEMLSAMLPVYQKHFTKNDVDALVAFYATPTGQNLLKEMPRITAEQLKPISGSLSAQRR